jgi:hypothetical protein
MEPALQRCVISLLVAGAVVFVLVGCGGGPSSAAPSRSVAADRSATGTTGESLAEKARTEFIAKADAVCGRQNAEITAVKPKSNTAQELTRLVHRNVALERKGLVQLGEFKPPDALAQRWQSILGYRRALIGELTALIQAVKHNDSSAIKALTASKKSTHSALRKAAKGAGFKQCSTVGTGK